MSKSYLPSFIHIVGFEPAGAVSRKSNVVAVPSAPRNTMKPPPPMLPAVGCVTARASAVAMAPSMALPPFLITVQPTSDAMSLAEMTMPPRARYGVLPAASGSVRAATSSAAIGAVNEHPNSTYALTVDYRRLHVTHPTIGYGDLREAAPLALAPDDDGIRRMDTSTGASELVVSYRALREIAPRPSMDGAIHWVSHIEVNPSSTRVVFLHRWTERIEDETCFLHRLITMNPDGTDLRILEDSDHPLPQLAGRFDPSAVGTYDYEKSEYQISHPLWRDDDHVIVWSPHAGRIHYHLYRDADDGAVEVIGGGTLVENGHMSFSPVDPRWLLSDTYPDPATHERILFVFDVATGRRHDLGSYYADPRLRKENRCDLHPRWSRDGREVCIDSVHESERQMYIVDVSSLTGGQQSAAAASTHLT